MGSVFLRGESWVGEYKDRGKVRRKTFGSKGVITKTLAREMLRRLELNVKLGQYEMLDTEIPTFTDYAKVYVAYQRDVKRIRSHERTRQCVEHFVRFYGDLKLNEISTEHIDLYKQKRLAEGVKQNTVARELQVIRNLFNHAYKRDKFFGKNPVTESGLPTFNDKKERVLTREEEVRLLDVCVDHLKDVIRIALNTGMRRGEILGLRWDWIDLDEFIINLPQTHTKTNKSRKVPINDVVRKILLERKLKSGGSEFVFPSDKSNNGHLQWLKRSFNTACKNADIEDLRFHDLKHTTITRMVEAGIPIIDISKIVGTSYKLIVERYSHQKESLRKAVESLANYS